MPLFRQLATVWVVTPSRRASSPLVSLSPSAWSWNSPSPISYAALSTRSEGGVPLSMTLARPFLVFSTIR